MNYEETKARLDELYKRVAANMRQADARMDAFVIALNDLRKTIDEDKQARGKLTHAIKESRLKAKESRAAFDKTIKRLNGFIDSLDARRNRRDDKQN